MRTRVQTMKLKKRLAVIKRAGRVALAVLTIQLVGAPATQARGAAQGGVEGEARAALQQAFERLRAGDYGGVYDALPTASQRRVTRARFVEALGKAREHFELNGMEIERAHVVGDLAAVDTVVYATVRKPIEAEGKIVSRQYMVREGGRWRVTTGEASTVRPLLAAHPDFAKKFPPREPRIFLKRDGRWVDMTQTLRGLAR